MSFSYLLCIVGARFVKTSFSHSVIVLYVLIDATLVDLDLLSFLTTRTLYSSTAVWSCMKSPDSVT
jgi:hypothetical protein